MPDWNAILRPEVSLAEKVLRPIIVYIALVLLLRAFGKRELAQLNPFDLVVLLSLSNTVQNAMIGNDNSLTGGLVGAIALLGVNYLVVRFLFRHRRLDQLLEGKPATLVDKGKIRHQALAAEMMTTSELLTVLHRQGFDSLNDVESCVLEPGGTFHIQRKTPAPDEVRQQALVAALADIQAKLDRLLASRTA